MRIKFRLVVKVKYEVVGRKDKRNGIKLGKRRRQLNTIIKSRRIDLIN